MSYKIYHNPRCRKSRETLAILEENGVQPEIVLYLENNPSREELVHLADLLDMKPIEFTRVKEDEFKSSGVAKDASDDVIFDLLAKTAKLIERPIVVKDDREAALGRPPENVLALIG